MSVMGQSFLLDKMMFFFYILWEGTYSCLFGIIRLSSYFVILCM